MPTTTPRHTLLAVEAANAVNAALGSSSLPELKYLAVYKVPGDGVTSPSLTEVDGAPVCGNDCVIFTYDTSAKKFATGAPFGQWGNDQTALPPERILCGSSPDRIGVKIYGTFHFITNLVGHGTMPLTAESILQLEPNGC